MAIVGGLDIHRRQITYDYLDTTTGETRRGQLSPATRLELRAWLDQFDGQQASFALEATTGWRFVTEELQRVGIGAHLAEPADTHALRGPKRRAKTDRTDARHLRELLRAGTLPESWPPPAHIADARTQVRLRRALIGARTGWYQRIHAVLFHHGLPDRCYLLTADGRAWLASVELPTVARGAVDLALRMIDQIDAELDGFDTALARIARAQPGCKALMRRYGIGWLTAVAIWAEFGDVRRFANARQAVRFTGLDITISESDSKRARGHLARQGSPVLRWALHEAAMCAARPGSPDHAYYLAVKQRLGGKRAALSVARKLAREAYHTLRALGDQALAPVAVELPTAA
ncbi:MAG TPA: IS110 family transposase [Actinomycetes bacterium]|jgi:transposase|nr:IS110 family transposase [Actinomycetes bacterium]